MWDEKHRPLVAELADVLEEWASLEYVVRERATELASWLESDAAQPVRLQGLLWLEHAARNAKGEWALREEVSDVVASLLFKVWQKEVHRVQGASGWPRGGAERSRARTERKAWKGVVRAGYSAMI